MYHVWTDIKGIDRLYKPLKDDKRPLFLRVADEFEKVCEHFKPNEEVGQVFPTVAEVHTLTRVKGVGYQTEMKSLTKRKAMRNARRSGSMDPAVFFTKDEFETYKRLKQETADFSWHLQ
eukprot:6033107-Amphidinium_carterae.1